LTRRRVSQLHGVAASLAAEETLMSPEIIKMAVVATDQNQ